MRSLNVRYFWVEFHEFTISHRHTWYCISPQLAMHSLKDGPVTFMVIGARWVLPGPCPAFFGHFSLSRRIQIFYSSVRPFIRSSISFLSIHPSLAHSLPLERPSKPALKPSPPILRLFRTPRPSPPSTPPSEPSRWIDIRLISLMTVGFPHLEIWWWNYW